MKTHLSQAARRRLSVDAWEALFRAQVAVIRKLQPDPIFKRVSMREYDVLYTLSKCPVDWLRLNELSKNVLLTQPSMSRLVERLEARGLIERRSADDDRRGLLLRLTDAGRELQRDVGREHAKDINALVGSALDEADMAELIRISRKLEAAVETS